MAYSLPFFSTSYIYGRSRSSLNPSNGLCKTCNYERFIKQETKLTSSKYSRRDAVLFTVVAEILRAQQQQESLQQPTGNAKESSKESLERIQIEQPTGNAKESSTESLERIQIDGEPPTIVLAPGRRIVAVGDMHGDLTKARHALEIAGVLSSDGHDYWTGGTTVLVQLGDILDRGEDEIAIMSLLRSLSLQAEINGGAVFQVNGNHETMNVEGDFRFADIGAFDEAEDFIEYSNEHRGDWNTAFIEWIKECQKWKARRKRPASGWTPWNLIEMQKRTMARSSLFRPGGQLACELARHGVVLKVNDWIFCHGGLLPHHVNYGIKQMNNEVARWMRGDNNKNGMLEEMPFIATRGYDSVVWSRLYSQEILDDESESYEICDILEAVLDSVNAKGMVVGHTPQTVGANSKCNNKIWRIDVGMSSGVLDAIPEVLEIIGDQVKVIRAGKQGMFREDMIDYFNI